MAKNPMLQAIEEAWKYQFLTYPNPAVGAAIVKNDILLAVEAHHQAGMPHAEVNACKSAFQNLSFSNTLEALTSSHDIHNFLIQNHNDCFKECEIYVTLEPCNHLGKTPACANLLKELGFKKVYIGSTDPNPKAKGGISTLKDAGICVKVGVEKEACDYLLYPFRQWIDGNFQFFKLAMREDGSIEGGYITTQDSLNLVHEIRTKLDLLIIGGETVRIDRPTLDSRFAKLNDPCDVLIYSTHNTFDPTIPLFDVPNRKVFISDNLPSHRKHFTMIEGGYSLLKSIKNQLDLVMIFLSHKEKKKNQFSLESLGLETIHSYWINSDDEILFCKITD
jgi:diaminohydroxyphosphoribosylaminopyrimidine deaminase/5-amino-6-(5-phosphoribosylamino)uracil reductase